MVITQVVIVWRFFFFHSSIPTLHNNKRFYKHFLNFQPLTRKEVGGQSYRTDDRETFPDAGKHIPDGDAAKPSPDGDAGTAGNREDLGAFIDGYINNEEYSDEARSYLLDCYQSGTPLDVIRQFARPQFSVKILKRLKKMYERSRYD